jgi:DNA polymerase III subunit delta'
MNYSWQQDQWLQIQRQRQQNRLPHALLFTGPAGTGKQRFARTLARSLLCTHSLDDGHACGDCEACRLFDAGTHPDMRWLQPTAPETSTSKNPVMAIKTGMIEALVDTLAATSQFGGYRCAVIAKAEKMNREAANRLLKTLEEPGEDTLIVLVCSHPTRLPATIRSRCQVIRFPLPRQSQALQWLASAGADSPDEAAPLQALRLSHGAPLLAKQFLDEWSDMHSVLAKALLATDDEMPLHYAPELAQMPKALSLTWLLDWIGDVGRLLTCGTNAVLVNENYRGKLAARVGQADAGRLFRLHDQVCELLRNDAIALNTLLMWENLLISWDGI